MKSIKEKIEFLGLSYKKEMRKISLIIVSLILLLIGVSFYMKSYMIAALGSPVVGLFYYLLISRYDSLVDKKIFDNEQEFISLLSYFKVYIANGNNVYHSFELLVPFCSSYMRKMVEKLLYEVDVDKSVAPFIRFAHNFKNNIFESIMMSIYQMVDNGENSQSLNQFDLVFSQISTSQNEKKLTNKQNSLSTVNMFPLIGTGIVSILLVVSIFSIMGDMINGI